jgi:hypothetical protein
MHLFNSKYYIQLYILMLLCSMCVVIYFSYFIYIVLLPLNLTNTLTYPIYYYNNYYQLNTNIAMTSINFINSLEINLPFFTTEYYYIQIICIILCILSIPYVFYLIKRVQFHYLFKYEFNYVRFLYYHFFMLYLFLLFCMYVYLIPYFLNWLFIHYTNFLIFEFDIQLNIQQLLNLYLKLFISILVICYFQKYVLLINYVYLFILFVLLINISDLGILLFCNIFFYICIKYLIYWNNLIINILLCYTYQSIVRRICHSNFNSRNISTDTY